MLKLIFVGTVIACASASAVKEHPVNDRIVSEIKAKARWTPMEAHENPLSKYSIEELEGMLGEVYDADISNENYSPITVRADLPTNFDAREKWPKYILPVRDQGRCGSCWAFGAAEALSDRIAILTQSMQKEDLST